MPATASISATVTLDGIDSALALIAGRLTFIERQQDRILVRLEWIERAVNANTVNDIITREALMADFTALHAEVEANGDAVASAIVLLTDLATRLTDAADDPAEIAAIAAELTAQSSALAEAVVANTPAAPEPTPEPEPAPEG
jgi:hypothetical protein